MYNVLLIDDEAGAGWKEIIEKVLFKGELIASTQDAGEAIELINKNKYDLIFLDLRFGEVDHNNYDVKQFGGFEILNKHIRKSFDAVNFSTPVLLFTASNKVWNILEMMENGIDDYFIKEHPDTAYDLDFSRNNYERLKKAIPELLKLGEQRNNIIEKSKLIISNSRKKIGTTNIKNRIEEKLKIAYGLLFRKTTKLEYSKLLFNNEIISFIVYWSILEEISHDYYNRINEEDSEWILAEGKIRLQFFNENGELETLFNTIKKEQNTPEIINKQSNAYQIALSNQICGILRWQLNWNKSKIHTIFLNKLNKYRNDIDFIHSSTDVIRKASLKSNQNSNIGYDKCLQIQDFIIELLT